MKSDAKFKEKLTVVSNAMRNLLNFCPNHSKTGKFHFDGLFLSKLYEVWGKKYRGVIFHDTNPDLVISKMGWGIGWTFIRALKSLYIDELFLYKAYNVSARKF